jgi:hypothetical protein
MQAYYLSRLMLSFAFGAIFVLTGSAGGLPS